MTASKALKSVSIGRSGGVPPYLQACALPTAGHNPLHHVEFGMMAAAAEHRVTASLHLWSVRPRDATLPARTTRLRPEKSGSFQRHRHGGFASGMMLSIRRLMRVVDTGIPDCESFEDRDIKFRDEKRMDTINAEYMWTPTSILPFMPRLFARPILIFDRLGHSAHGALCTYHLCNNAIRDIGGHHARDLGRVALGPRGNSLL
jgi:hypothetical protein